MAAPRCQAITKAGTPCTVNAMTGSPFCLVHNPETLDLRRQAGAKGGRERAAARQAVKLIPRQMSAAELGGVLVGVLEALIAGTLEAKTAAAAANVVRTLLEVNAAAQQPRLEEVVAELEGLRRVV